MAVTSVRLQPELDWALDELAKKLDRTKSYLINQSVKDFLAKKSQEELRWIETLSAIDSVECGNVIEESEVTNWLESWGSNNELSPPTL